MVAALAVDAVGKQNVHCVTLPSRHTADDSLRDAKDCAERLGVRYDVLPLTGPLDAVTAELAGVLGGRPADATEENMQARLRGMMLMAISDKLGNLLLATADKSKLAVGHTALFGDMVAGFNPLKDVLKTEVQALAGWRNAHLPGDCFGPGGEVIPQAILDKPPSAELKPNQKGEDTLPPPPVLDEMLTGLIAEVLDRGRGRLNLSLIKRVEKLIVQSEAERRQSPPGPKLTAKAFGAGRRYPLTNAYRDDGLHGTSAGSGERL